MTSFELKALAVLAVIRLAIWLADRHLQKKGR